MAPAPGDPSTSPTPFRSPTESSLTVNGRSAAFRLPTSISSASTGASDPVSTHRQAPIQRSRRTTTGCSRDRPYRRRWPSKRALVSRVQRTLQHAPRCLNVGLTHRYDEGYRMVRRGRNLDRAPEMRFNDLSEPHRTRTVVTSNQRATCCQALSSSLRTSTICCGNGSIRYWSSRFRTNGSRLFVNLSKRAKPPAAKASPTREDPNRTEHQATEPVTSGARLPDQLQDAVATACA